MMVKSDMQWKLMEAQREENISVVSTGTSPSLNINNKLEYEMTTLNASHDILILTHIYKTNNTNNTNTTVESDGGFEANDHDLYFIIFTSVILAILILSTIIGNVFVIAAIFLERNLRTVGNYLVLSLAVADTLVACLVMPLGAVYEVAQEWSLGSEMCDIWTSADVLCCTASILHLLAIAMDRYWAVTNVDYIHQRNAKRIGIMIFAVWTVAFVVSIAPFFGWKDSEFMVRIEQEKRCLISQDIGYQIFATVATFYGPLIFILVLYWKIFQVARKRIRRKPGKMIVPVSSAQPPRPLAQSVSKLNIDCTDNHNEHTEHTEMCHLNNSPPEESQLSTNGEKFIATNCSNNNPSSSSSNHQDQSQIQIHILKQKKNTKESIELKRERKAAKTLAIITGVFVICWLPFFVCAILMSICAQCEVHKYIFSVFQWLGYVNSLLNPIIYTIFSPDFRNGFRRILCGRNHNANRRRN